MANFHSKMTAKDYQSTYDSLLSDIELIKRRVAKRLQALAIEFPDAPIHIMGDTVIKAKSIVEMRSVETIDIEKQIIMIGKIEKWLADKHPHKQLAIMFNDKKEEDESK